jgi:hypothetical protein
VCVCVGGGGGLSRYSTARTLAALDGPGQEAEAGAGAGASQPAGPHVKDSAVAHTNGDSSYDNAEGGGKGVEGDGGKKSGGGEGGGDGGGSSGGEARDGDWLAARGDVFGESGSRPTSF